MKSFSEKSPPTSLRQRAEFFPSSAKRGKGKFFLNTGFTLLEIMISLAIISGLLVTLIYSLNYHLGIAESHEFITIGSMLAKNKLTEIETNPASSKGDFPEPYAAYHFVAEVKKYPFPGISEISVIVSRDRDEVKFSRLLGTAK